MLKRLIKSPLFWYAVWVGISAASVRANPIPAPPSPDFAMPVPDAPPTVAEGDRLTLRQAVTIGLRDNPQSAYARYTVDSARENLTSQRAPINPTLQYSGLNNTVASATNVTNPANYVAYVTLETNGAQRWRASQAREQVHQAQADADTTRLSLKENIVSAYVALQIADKALGIEQEVYENVRQLSYLTSKRFEIGASPRADSVRASIALVQEQQNVLTDTTNILIARATLNSVLGRAPLHPVDVSEPLDYRPIALPDIAALVRMAEENRPEIRSAVFNGRSLRALEKLENSNYLPDLILGRDFEKHGSVQVGAVLPLDLGSIHGAVRKTRADIQAQEAQAVIQRQNVLLDVQNSYTSLVSARQQVESYKNGILRESESLLSQTKQGYTLGAGTILDLLTAETTYRSTLTAYYVAVGNYRQAVYVLEHAIAAPLASVADSPSIELPRNDPAVVLPPDKP